MFMCLDSRAFPVVHQEVAMSASSTIAPADAPPVGRRIVAPPQRPLASAAALPEMRWAAAATVLFVLGGLCQLAGAPAALWWTLYLTCYATGGWEPALVGLRALRARTLDVDLLMIVAAVLAASIGQILDGALLIVIFATSGALEAFATRRTEDSVKALLDLAPEQATRLLPDDLEEQVDAAELAVGDVIVIRPGERVGADGRVVEGLSEVDQASITGEPMAVVRGVGQDVFAGTLNGSGALTVEVTRAAADSVVARIVALVGEASATKARTQLFIEKVEQRYSVGVVAATVALFVVPLVLGSAVEPALLRAMTFMIVASPCAVVLATMPPLLAAIANAGRHGVLVKSAVALEELGKVNQVAFDKTGTLTHGTPQVAALVAFGAMSEATVLRLAASAERRSEHPVAEAIVTAAVECSLALSDATDFTSTPGRGIRAVVDAREVRVESPALLDTDSATHLAEMREQVTAYESTGHTVVVVAVDGAACGIIALTDQVREQSEATVRALTILTGSTPVLLTGDNRHAAARLAAAVGIDRVEAELMPHQKVDAVAVLMRDPTTGRSRQLMLVGDGVNDAPAMAAAHVGVAMGRHGSDLALETADVVLVRDDLSALPTTIALARRAHRVVKANLVIAATVIGVLALWDIVATLPLPLGVAGHEGSTILVALNGLRLLRKNAWR
jgi:heavy metal translocating P-type ATPase